MRKDDDGFLQEVYNKQFNYGDGYGFSIGL